MDFREGFSSQEKGELVAAAHDKGCRFLAMSQVIVNTHASAVAEYIYDKNWDVPLNAVTDLVARAMTIGAFETFLTTTRAELEVAGISKSSLTFESVLNHMASDPEAFKIYDQMASMVVTADRLSMDQLPYVKEYREVIEQVWESERHG